MLLHNVTVCHESSVSVLCASAAQAFLLMRHSPHVMFLDPPWPSSSASSNERVVDIHLPQPATLTICDFFRQAHLRAGAAIVAAKLPLAFDVDALALDLTCQELGAGPLTSERPFPFIFTFGAIRFFVALFPLKYCHPSRAAVAPSPTLQFGNRKLDAIIGAVRAWNSEVASGPRFFDYEAGKWVPLSKWRKCSMA
jgi:hypothetical protein